MYEKGERKKNPENYRESEWQGSLIIISLSVLLITHVHTQTQGARAVDRDFDFTRSFHGSLNTLRFTIDVQCSMVRPKPSSAYPLAFFSRAEGWKYRGAWWIITGWRDRVAGPHRQIKFTPFASKASNVPLTFSHPYLDTLWKLDGIKLKGEIYFHKIEINLFQSRRVDSRIFQFLPPIIL